MLDVIAEIAAAFVLVAFGSLVIYVTITLRRWVRHIDRWLEYLDRELEEEE